MNRTSTFAGLLLVLLFSRASFGAGGGETKTEETKEATIATRPNILFLLADDQRADTVGALGNERIKTPNLDQLVTSGTTFTNAYCMGSTSGAVCVPSRAMINSGRTLFRVKNNLSDSKILPEVLRQSGYTTFGTGKWHNQSAAFARGFVSGKAVFFGGMSDHTKVPLVDVDADGKQVNRRTGDKFSSTIFADAAIEFIKGHSGEKPFYAYVAFTAPHDPRQAPEGYIDMYDPAAMELPENFMPQHPFYNGWMTGRDEQLAPWPRTEMVIRQQLAEYYGLITHMDFEIGRILQALRETGHAENTVIIYSADHGLALGSHGLVGKQSLYEHSLRAPLIFAGPGMPENQKRDALVYLLDICPTVYAIANVEAPAEVEGKNLLPVIEGKEESVRDSIFTAFQDVMRSVRTDRWKLIRYPHINKTQLFDLQSDPHELKDLADDPDHANKVEELMALLVEHQKEVGDEQPLTSDSPQSAEVDLSNERRSPDRHQPQWIIEKYFSEEMAEKGNGEKK